ncbi:CbtA family protein [Actinomadura chokoriensis]|uniref:CbtA family protein n=1 Tax=Actinomadura chokoriensis TaxID=454156 RepID=A0ABV4R1A1_9ACTN
MIRALLIRGMLAGLIAGMVATVFAWFVGEPAIRDAISYEEGHDQAGAAHSHVAGASPHVHEAAEAAVSRGVQETLGLSVALALFGIAIGGIFALVFAGLHGRLGELTARPISALLAGAGFVLVGLVPFTKYPANPPAVGHEDTIGSRTVSYLALITVSIIAVVIATQTARRLTARLGVWNATLIGGGVFLVLVGIASITLPGFNEVPADYPAAVLWRFRIASLATTAIIWTVLGLVFGALAARVIDTSNTHSAMGVARSQ